MISVPVEANSVTANTTLKSAAGYVLAITLAAGSDAATATFYDNTSASGEVEWVIKAAANTSASVVFNARRPLRFNTGITVALSGTSPRVSVQFE